MEEQMENSKEINWSAMTYEELEERQYKMFDSWKAAFPEPEERHINLLEMVQDRIYKKWAMAHPEEAGLRAKEEERVMKELMTELQARFGSGERKTVVRPVKRTPWSVAVREVTKLNYEGMPYEELSEYQDKLTKAWSATFQGPTQEQEWMLEDAWGDVYDLWAKANPEKAAGMNKIWAAMEDVDQTTYADLEG